VFARLAIWVYATYSVNFSGAYVLFDKYWQ